MGDGTESGCLASDCWTLPEEAVQSMEASDVFSFWVGLTSRRQATRRECCIRTQVTRWRHTFAFSRRAVETVGQVDSVVEQSGEGTVLHCRHLHSLRRWDWNTKNNPGLLCLELRL